MKTATVTNDTDEHIVVIDGPPEYQAYGARCWCGWIGPTRILEEGAVGDAEIHLHQTGHDKTVPPEVQI